ncbi:hypothetical protein Catovirus_2_238 [Catovirus CTV1]|uniref:Uncharacterized protein n=1 Tax=Catovirus CTV1 TaxID=1977631 RepID=A0A1V0SC55_9VIRU|nr:hypothetical protein Catovirus_2_238 [Catovirus CTV1]
MFISFLILYIISPAPQVVIKNPSVNNDISDLYVDDSGVCYRYKRQKIKCDGI